MQPLLQLFFFFSALFVIIINHYYGSDYVGLWANTIRIFNSLLIFLLAASLPFMLNMLRDKKICLSKKNIFLFMVFIFTISCNIFFCSNKFGFICFFLFFNILI